MEQLIQFINQYTYLSTEAINDLESKIEFECFNKNDIILNQGNVANKVWFLKSGLARKFYLHNGKEITTWIHTENEMFTSMHSYFYQKPSNEIIQASEKTELISITRQNSIKLNKYPEMDCFSKELIVKQFGYIDEFSKKFSLMSAKEKYEALKEIAPQMVKKAKLGHIASIMGVSQETLSRVRAKI